MIDAYRYRKYAEELIAEAEAAYEEARSSLWNALTIAVQSGLKLSVV